MAKHAPTVMVSSTFYDLRQIRQDLASFIEKELGYNALLSEFNSFPIDPDVDTIENCRRRVERDADILILIIGGRYGYVDQNSDKSVTNLEYLTARAKSIPIYTFIDKGVLSVLPIWEQNPEANFSGVVSDPKVFEFIKQIRLTNKGWTYEFEYAQTIIQTLRVQFAFLQQEGLQATRTLSLHSEDLPVDISGKALRLVLEQPSYWEYYLFAQVLIDEAAKCSELKEEYRLKLRFRTGNSITADNGLDWFQNKVDELSRLVEAITVLVNDYLIEEVGPSGKPGNSKGLVFIAKKVIEVYRQALEWTREVRQIYAPQCLHPLIEEMLKFPNDLIEQLGDYGPRIIREIDAIRLSSKESNQQAAGITLNITTVVSDGFGDLLRNCFLDCYAQERQK